MEGSFSYKILDRTMDTNYQLFLLFYVHTRRLVFVSNTTQARVLEVRTHAAYWRITCGYTELLSKAIGSLPS